MKIQYQIFVESFDSHDSINKSQKPRPLISLSEYVDKHPDISRVMRLNNHVFDTYEDAIAWYKTFDLEYDDQRNKYNKTQKSLLGYNAIECYASLPKKLFFIPTVTVE